MTLGLVLQHVGMDEIYVGLAINHVLNRRVPLPVLLMQCFLFHHPTYVCRKRLISCRVFLVGGAEARGMPNDTVVAYTPLGASLRDRLRNVPLPFGYFSSTLNYSGTYSHPGSLIFKMPER